MKRIIATGNPGYGLAKTLSEHLAADFCSRANGYDLATGEGRKRFIEKSLNYDVFLNNSLLGEFRQAVLLHELWNSWKEAGKSGQIINIGSTADTTIKAQGHLYASEKVALKHYNRQLTYACLFAQSKIRSTYIAPGYLDTPRENELRPQVKKLQLTRLSEIIAWLIDQPDNFNINEMSLDPIQE